MKITSVTVTDDAGVQHTWDGLEGYVQITNAQRKSEHKGAPATIVGKQILVSLIVPKE